MPALFETAYAPLRGFEGGWCNDPGDAGGETYGGIARNFYSNWQGWAIIDAAKSNTSFRQGASAFSRHLAGIPGLADLVTEWFRVEWWNRMGLEQFPQAVANEIFEQSVNLGRGGAGKYLQRMCNAMNFSKFTGQRLFEDLKEDGAVGGKTLAALATILAKRTSVESIVHALNCMQGAHYVGLGAKNYDHRQFVDGWMTRTF